MPDARRELDDRQLAFLSRSAVDVSPRLRRVLLALALIGLGLIVAAIVVSMFLAIMDVQSGL